MILHSGKVGHRRLVQPRRASSDGAVFFGGVASWLDPVGSTRVARPGWLTPGGSTRVAHPGWLDPAEGSVGLRILPPCPVVGRHAERPAARRPRVRRFRSGPFEPRVTAGSASVTAVLNAGPDVHAAARASGRKSARSRCDVGSPPPSDGGRKPWRLVSRSSGLEGSASPGTAQGPGETGSSARDPLPVGGPGRVPTMDAEKRFS